MDANGNVYFVDSVNNVVKKINQATNLITAVVGTGAFGYGEPSYDGDGGLATGALLAIPFSTAVEPNGNILVQCIVELWRVTVADGKIHYIAGSDTLGFAGDGGSPTSAVYAGMLFVSTAPNDDILISDVGNYRVRRIDSGLINTVAGTTIQDNIPATSAVLNFPDGLLPDGKGNLVIADTGDSRIRTVGQNGVLTATYGTGIRGNTGSEMFFPSGMAMDAQGNVYIADTGNDRVLRVLAGGSPSVFAGGNGEGYGGDNGYAPRALLSAPTGVAVDGAGNVYIADAGNFRVRIVDSNQNITTFAGTGDPRFSGEGGPAGQAGLTVNDLTIAAGSLYIADTANNRVRKVDLSTKTITTVAGIGTPGYTGDNGPAFSAQLNLPASVALDPAGNLLIADRGNLVVRRVSGGTISTIAGNGKPLFNAETGTALGISIDPSRVQVDTNGNIFISDSGNDRVRKLTVQTPAVMTIAAGNNQSGPSGNTVSIAVQVADATGMAVGNVLVNFSVSSGSASLGSSSARTGGNGIASVPVTLGQTAGPVTIAAAAAGLSGVTFSLTVTPAVIVTLAPQITSVRGAGFSTPAVLALSPGGIATVLGLNFGAPGTFQSVGQGDLVNGQVPVNFLGVCVQVGGTGAPILGVSNTQVNFQTPAVSSGSSALTVISSCGTSSALSSAPASVTIQISTPEFFYFANNPSGQNPVAAVDPQTGVYLASASLYPGAGFVPAQPGEYVTVYGTGFGPTDPAVAPGSFFNQGANATGTVTVTLGGQPLPAANILYTGITPGSPGLYQLNLLLPTNTPDGDLPLVIVVGGVASPAGAYLTVQHQ